jgi:hypothetical protein
VPVAVPFLLHNGHLPDSLSISSKLRSQPRSQSQTMTSLTSTAPRHKQQHPLTQTPACKAHRRGMTSTMLTRPAYQACTTAQQAYVAHMCMPSAHLCMPSVLAAPQEQVRQAAGINRSVQRTVKTWAGQPQPNDRPHICAGQNKFSGLPNNSSAHACCSTALKSLPVQTISTKQQGLSCAGRAMVTQPENAEASR